MSSEPVKDAGYAETGKAKSFKILFHGEGFAFFKLKLVQAFLTIITLGIYWAWARAATRKYIYSNTEFAGSRFAFHGTGKEIFIGMLKALGIFGIFIIMFFIAGIIKNRVASVVLVLSAYAGIFLLIPLVLYGSMRYRFSRTSWRGIRFRYNGTLKELYMLFLKAVPLFIITLGLYTVFFQVKLRKLLLGNISFGNVRLQFTGKGGDLFEIVVKGVILSIVTLGIYSFWFTAKRFNFLWGNIDVDQEGKKSSFHATMTAGKYFKFSIISIGLTIVTLGLGLPWVLMRGMRLVAENIEVAGDFDPDALVQGAVDKIGASGEELGSLLDVDAGIMFG
jgi:uncharacterized membrane protein YjgN (DUF898 family)